MANTKSMSKSALIGHLAEANELTRKQVIAFKHSKPKRALAYKCTHLLGGFFVEHHAFIDRHERDLEIGLFRWRDSKPSLSRPHRGIGVNFETKRFYVKIVRAVLIENENTDVIKFCDHSEMIIL